MCFRWLIKRAGGWTTEIGNKDKRVEDGKAEGMDFLLFNIRSF